MKHISFVTVNLAIHALTNQREKECLKWNYSNVGETATIVGVVHDEELFRGYTTAIAELELYKKDVMVNLKKETE